MNYKIVELKKGKEGSAIFGHPWIFSGAISQTSEQIEHGEIVHVTDSQKNILGTGTYSEYSGIAVRIFDFAKTELNESRLKEKLTLALTKRTLLGYTNNQNTTGYRIVFGEADGLPGLILDKYADTVVIQISTAGMENLKPLLLKTIHAVLKPKLIIERSDLSVRSEDRLPETKEVLFGKTKDGIVAFKENGIDFFADTLSGQKTGFFLDQKDLRSTLAPLAKDRTVVDIFSYTGAAGIYALKNKATHVTFMDSSTRALEIAKKHVEKNFKTASAKVATKNCTFIEEDAFIYTGNIKTPQFDMVLLDPPALIKSQRDAENGKKAYHFLNRASLRMIKDNGIFCSSSCSHFLTEEDFMFILRRAAKQAGVTLHTLYSIRQSPDHPIDISFPESKYLKSFVFLAKRDAFLS
ncbi:MAG: class I SAM-dependent rRNA methyltransferase [Candidatus Gracilibacteria bacterium]|jgi:23S rRNA (cytosine1962-C5)-methyltransferase